MNALFCYGSNTPAQIIYRLRLVGAKQRRFLDLVESAYLPKHGRVFRGMSRNWGGGTASIESDPNRTIYGYVCYLDDDQLRLLDRFEGLSVRPPKYKRVTKTITVVTSGGQSKVKAFVYVSTSNEYNKPTNAYLDAIVAMLNIFWSGGGRIRRKDIPLRNNPDFTGLTYDQIKVILSRMSLEERQEAVFGNSLPHPSTIMERRWWHPDEVYRTLTDEVLRQLNDPENYIVRVNKIVFIPDEWTLEAMDTDMASDYVDFLLDQDEDGMYPMIGLSADWAATAYAVKPPKRLGDEDFGTRVGGVVFNFDEPLDESDISTVQYYGEDVHVYNHVLVQEEDEIDQPWTLLRFTGVIDPDTDTPQYEVIESDIMGMELLEQLIVEEDSESDDDPIVFPTRSNRGVSTSKKKLKSQRKL